MFDLSMIETLNNFLETPTAARAIAFGMLISWGGTQLVKFNPLVRKLLNHLPPEMGRTVVQAIAFLLAFIPTFLLWPGMGTVKVLGSIVVGTWSPKAYQKATVVLYHFFPYLEPKLSATPVPKEK